MRSAITVVAEQSRLERRLSRTTTRGALVETLEAYLVCLCASHLGASSGPGVSAAGL